MRDKQLVIHLDSTLLRFLVVLLRKSTYDQIKWRIGIQDIKTLQVMINTFKEK